MPDFHRSGREAEKNDFGKLELILKNKYEIERAILLRHRIEDEGTPLKFIPRSCRSKP